MNWKQWHFYVTKSRKQDKSEWLYVAEKDNGLNMVWGTRGFWGHGRTLESIWIELIKEWYPDIVIEMTDDAIMALADTTEEVREQFQEVQIN